ncbi:MAG: hypothetical protein RBS16_06755 [Candidatus Cloacimonadales bacterium]|jgi:hypothetical protein|nr:hypothetical protein [Candidatus Cloacimonadota bacterium]MDX9977717.1 hypothetical protein [Candidatus Cloacimonadales bacterium]
MKTQFIIAAALFYTCLLVAKPAAIEKNHNKTIHKIEMAFKTQKSELGNISTIEIANTEEYFWKLNNTNQSYVNEKMYSEIIYETKRTYRDPVKLQIYCDDIEEGLEIEAFCEDFDITKIFDTKDKFRYKDYNQGNLIKKHVSVNKEKQTMIEDIYNCKVKLKIYFIVHIDTRIPAGKTINIKYTLSN